ncbi:unnamed protein product, partial [Dicrocoelium dendriticum]
MLAKQIAISVVIDSLGFYSRSNEIGDTSNDNEGKIDLYRLQFFSPAEHVPSEMTTKSLLNPVNRLDTTLMNTAHRVELPMICSQKQSE